jgi:hypothetical protein
MMSMQGLIGVRALVWTLGLTSKYWIEGNTSFGKSASISPNTSRVISFYLRQPGPQSYCKIDLQVSAFRHGRHQARRKEICA